MSIFHFKRSARSDIAASDFYKFILNNHGESRAFMSNQELLGSDKVNIYVEK